MRARELRKKLEKIARENTNDNERFKQLVRALLKDIMDRFVKRYRNSRVGVVVGARDKLPVELSGILFSFATAEPLSSYGCPDGAVAILARYIPAGLRRVKCECPCHTTGAMHIVACCPGGYKNVFDGKKLPGRSKWIKFPRKFMGLPVYYRLGSPFEVRDTSR